MDSPAVEGHRPTGTHYFSTVNLLSYGCSVLLFPFLLDGEGVKVRG